MGLAPRVGAGELGRRVGRPVPAGFPVMAEGLGDLAASTTTSSSTESHRDASYVADSRRRPRLGLAVTDAAGELI